MATGITDKMESLTAAEVAKLLTTIRQSDSIELKVTVDESHLLDSANSLGLDPLNAQIRQVYFFDTPDLQLNNLGVVVRARRVQMKPSESTIKLRPVEPATLKSKYRKSPNFKVEVDGTGSGWVCSASLGSFLGERDVRKHLLDGKAIRKLFSDYQQEYFAEHAPGFSLDGLSVLGPIFVLKGQATPKEFNSKLAAEMWLYPDGTRILELSSKCLPGQGLDLAMSMKALLEDRAISLSESQTTKTSKALTYFSERLQQEASVAK